MSDEFEEQEKPKHPEPAKMSKQELFSPSNLDERNLIPNANAFNKPFTALAIPNQSGTDLSALDEKVRSLMERGQNMIPNGAKDRNGTPIQQITCICKVCGKEGLSKNVKSHIEANHLEGISIPCDFCDKKFSSRPSLANHKSKYHKQGNYSLRRPPKLIIPQAVIRH